MTAKDIFAGRSPGATSPAGGAVAVTLDTDVAVVSRGIYVGGAGDIAVVMLDGSTVTFKAAAAGSILPIRITRVVAAGTTATNLLVLV